MIIALHAFRSVAVWGNGNDGIAGRLRLLGCIVFIASIGGLKN